MNTKLQDFVKRNQKRNAHLYLSGAIIGYDYVICPISNERLSMIKDNYIIKILGMDVLDYPVTQRTCNKRKDNIKIGLQQIDPKFGITKYEVGQRKARAILAHVDTNGVTGYDRKGQATRTAHMANIDELGRNGYSQLASRAILKGNSTKAANGLITSVNARNEFHRYKLIVLYLTSKYKEELTAGYVTGLAGTPGAWHIDHQFSILKGYQQHVSPIVIGHVNNLKMIPWGENISKHSKCSISLDDLFTACGYTNEQSQIENNIITNIILTDIKNNIRPNAAFLLERYYESTLRT